MPTPNRVTPTPRPQLGNLLRCPRCAWASFTAGDVGLDRDTAHRIVDEHVRMRHPEEPLRVDEFVAAAVAQLTRPRS